MVQKNKNNKKIPPKLKISSLFTLQVLLMIQYILQKEKTRVVIINEKIRIKNEEIIIRNIKKNITRRKIISTVMIINQRIKRITIMMINIKRTNRTTNNLESRSQIMEKVVKEMMITMKTMNTIIVITEIKIIKVNSKIDHQSLRKLNQIKINMITAAIMIMIMMN